MTAYAWISIFIFSLAVLFIRKRLTLRENIIIFVTIAFVAQMSDRFVGSILDLFDIGPTKEVNLIDLFFVPIVPSCIAILYLNTFKRNRYVIYAIVWTLLSFFYEWSLVYFGYMKLKGWNAWYSIPFYLLTYFTLPWYLKFIRKEHTKKFMLPNKTSIKIMQKGQKAK